MCPHNQHQSLHDYNWHLAYEPIVQHQNLSDSNIPNTGSAVHRNTNVLYVTFAFVPEDHLPSLPDLRIPDLLRELRLKLDGFSAPNATLRNGADPFATAVQLWLQKQTFSEWAEVEAQRQWQKALMNDLGWIQQRIIGQLSGWKANELTLPDVESTLASQPLIGEVKNKHNTMSHGARVGLYDKLEEFLDSPEYAGCTALVITLQRAKRFQGGRNWARFAPGKKHDRPDILEVGGRVFYALATAPDRPMPTQQLETADLSTWSSWRSIDAMSKQFLDSLADLQGSPVTQQISEICVRSLKW